MSRTTRYKCCKCGLSHPCYSTVVSASINTKTIPIGCLGSKTKDPEWKEIQEEEPEHIEKEASSNAGWFCSNCPQGPCGVPHPFNTKELLELDSKIVYCRSHCVVFPGRQAAWVWEDPLHLPNVPPTKPQKETNQKHLPEDLERKILKGLSLLGKWVQMVDKVFKKGIAKRIVIENGKVYAAIFPSERDNSYYITDIDKIEELS